MQDKTHNDNFSIFLLTLLAQCLLIDTNVKIFSAIVHTGIGPVQVNNLLATLNLPPVCPSTLKRNEQKVDIALKTEADKSCSEAQKEEIEKGNGKVSYQDFLC